MRSPRTSIVRTAVLVPTAIMALMSLLLLADPFPSTTASFADADPEPDNVFTTAYWTTIGATADAYVNEDQPSQNQGSASELKVRSEVNKNIQSFVEFDLSSVPAGNEILKAALSLCATAISTTRTHEIHLVDAAWVENTITWSNQPTAQAGISDSATTPASPSCMTWDLLASDVQPWVAGVVNYGWRSNDSVQSEPTGIGTTFRSREDTAVPAEQPSLYVIYRTCTDTTAPAAPANLVSAPADSQVGLNWDDNGEPDLVGYNVYRSTTLGGPYSKLNSNLEISSGYVDTAVTNGTTYYYVVTALDKCANESIDSSEVSATPDTVPPAPPVNLVAAPGNAQVGLDWNDNSEPDLDGYNVYRSTTQGGPYSKVNGPLVTVSDYLNTGLSNGTTYYFVVRAENSNSQESGNSNEDSAAPEDLPPSAPTNLGTTPASTQVVLDWDDNSEPDLAGYNVYRSTTQGGPYSKVNGPIVTVSNYTDTGLTNGTTYYYVVRAEDDATQESSDSNESSATPNTIPPQPPTGLAATGGEKEIDLNWDDNVEPDLDGYNVYRSTSQGGPYSKINGSLVSSSDYSDTGLTGGVTYYYVVRAENTAAQESGDSNEANAVPYSILVAAKDSSVSLEKPDENQNGTQDVKVFIISNEDKDQRIFVEFDMSEVQSGSTVSSATLTLCALAVPSSTRTYEVHRATAAWGEGTITWNNQPGVEAAATDSQATPGSPGCMTWTVTADVQAWADGTANNGWRIKDQNEGDPDQEYKAEFRSREDTGVPADRPSLEAHWTAP